MPAAKYRGRYSQKPKGKVFTEVHQKFIDAYLSNGEKLRPAIHVAMGWSDEMKEIGKFQYMSAYTRLYKHPRVQEAIERAHSLVAMRTEKMLEQYAVSKEDVLNELAKIAFTNPTDVMSWKEGEGVSVKSSDEIHPDKIGAIAEVTERKDKKVSVKMVDKRQALVDLGKALGLFTEKHDHTHKAVNVNFTIEK